MSNAAIAARAPQKRVKEPWEPIPGSSQELALDTRCNVTFYHGARGPGKTDTQLMRFYRRVGQGFGPFWRGVIFDREYKNLDDLVSKSKRWFYGHDDGAKFLSSSADYKWVWPTGEELLFRQAKKSDDYWNYHGQEFPFIGWNELCKYPTPELFDTLMSCNRSSYTVEKNAPLNSDGSLVDTGPIPLEIFATGNPYGPGHGWVKRRLIDPAPDGDVVPQTINVFNPRTGKREDIVKTQVAIFGSYRENIYLDPQYVATLEAITDVNKRKAWLEGDWSVVAGGALDDVWRENVHVKPRFVIPTSWRIDRSFDWGSTHPSACIWWAEADGTEATLPDGTKWCPRPGSIIACAELYRNEKDKDNVGLRESATRIAELIKATEIRLLTSGPLSIVGNNIDASARWFHKQPWPGPADNQIRNVIMSDIATIETQMAKIGVRWTESDKSPGSRKIGLQLVRDRLENAIIHAETGDARGPGLYFMSNCRMSIATVPMLPRDPNEPDDVDTEAEDHLYDCVRYRVLAASNRYSSTIKVFFPT